MQHVVPGHAGVVDEDRRLAQLLDDALERGLHGGLVGDVGAHGESLAAGRLDGLDRAGAGVLVEVENGDCVTFGSQTLGDGCADAASSSGDDGDAGRGHSDSLMFEWRGPSPPVERRPDEPMSFVG